MAVNNLHNIKNDIVLSPLYEKISKIASDFQVNGQKLYLYTNITCICNFKLPLIRHCTYSQGIVMSIIGCFLPLIPSKCKIDNSLFTFVILFINNLTSITDLVED